MSRIRKLYFFDKYKLKEMISFLNNSEDDSYINNIMFNPLIPFHHLIPLKFKFLPESYVLKDKNEIKGLITVEPTRCPAKQMEIQKLFFEENCYDCAGELIQYVVSKYKALGTASLLVKINDFMPELVKLFISKCNFSQISYEKLWKIGDFNEVKYSKKDFREFRNSDSAVVSSLYNESLLPHIRPLLSSDSKEFRENIFKGLSYFSEYKYIWEERKTNNILAYISIQTSDNKNYILDIIASSWTEIDIDKILTFAHNTIRKRNKKFSLLIKTKKYTHFGEQYEKEFLQRKYECVQNQIVLTNSSAKIIHEPENSKKFTVLNKLYSGMSANTGTTCKG